MPFLLWSGLALAVGYSVKNAGEGVDKASNGTVKIALACGAIYLIANKGKVFG